MIMKYPASVFKCVGLNSNKCLYNNNIIAVPTCLAV